MNGSAAGGALLVMVTPHHTWRVCWSLSQLSVPSMRLVWGQHGHLYPVGSGGESRLVHSPSFLSPAYNLWEEHSWAPSLALTTCSSFTSWFFRFFIMWVFTCQLYGCVHTSTEERALDPLELELQAAVNRRMWVLECRNAPERVVCAHSH